MKHILFCVFVLLSLGFIKALPFKRLKKSEDSSLLRPDNSFLETDMTLGATAKYGYSANLSTLATTGSWEDWMKRLDFKLIPLALLFKVKTEGKGTLQKDAAAVKAVKKFERKLDEEIKTYAETPANFRPDLVAIIKKKGWKDKAKEWLADLGADGGLTQACKATKEANQPKCSCWEAQTIRIDFLQTLVETVAKKGMQYHEDDEEPAISVRDARNMVGVSMGTDSCKSDVDLTISGKIAIKFQKLLYEFFEEMYHSNPDKMFDTNFYVAEFAHSSQAYPTAPHCTEVVRRADPASVVYLANPHNEDVADQAAIAADQHKNAFKFLKQALSEVGTGRFGNFKFRPAGCEIDSKNFCGLVSKAMDNFTTKATVDAAREALRGEYIPTWRIIKKTKTNKLEDICKEYDVDCQNLIKEPEKIKAYSKIAAELYAIIGQEAATKEDCTKFAKLTSPIASLAPESYWTRNTFAHSVTCRQGNYDVPLYAYELFDSFIENFGHLVHSAKHKHIEAPDPGLPYLSKYMWRMLDAGHAVCARIFRPKIGTEHGKLGEHFADVGPMCDKIRTQVTAVLALYKARNKANKATEIADTRTALGISGTSVNVVSDLVNSALNTVVEFTKWYYLIRAHINSDYRIEHYNQAIQCSTLP